MAHIIYTAETCNLVNHSLIRAAIKYFALTLFNGSRQTFTTFKRVPYIGMECDGVLVEKLTNYKLFDNGQCFDFAFLGESMMNIYVTHFIPKGNINCFTECEQRFARDPYRLQKK